MTTRINASCRVAAALVFAVALNGTLPAVAAFAAPENDKATFAVRKEQNEKRQDNANKGKKDQQDKKADKTTDTSVAESREEYKEPAKQEDQKSPKHEATPVTAAPKASSNGKASSEKNHTSYWESLGYGVCVKYDGVNTKTFSVPSTSEKQYSLAVVKAGSFASVTNPNETDETVAGGDTLVHTSGKDISHVILCQKASAVAATPKESAPKKDACPEVPGMQDNKKQCKLEQAVNNPGTTKPNETGKVLDGATTAAAATTPTTLPKTGLSVIASVIMAMSASVLAYAVTFFTRRRLVNS